MRLRVMDPSEEATQLAEPGDPMRRHQRRVWLSLLALGLSPERARDVAQTAWLRLLEKHGVDGLARSALPGLAIAQARFLALDELRRQRREERGLAAVEAPPPDLLDPERRAMGRRDLERALAAVATLHASAQRVFLLVYGDPPREPAAVAAELGLSLQRVRQILTEVRRHLRPVLEEIEP